MALYADRVKDSTSITGTGAITLSGTAPTGFQSFATAFGATPQTVAYCIADQTGNNWEVGTGVFNGTTGLTRVTVLGSSNAGALVNFTSGTKDIFCTAPAAYLLPAGSTTQIQYNNAGAFGGSANFTYNTGTNTFTVGPAGATTTIETLAPTGSTIAGTMRFRGKNASATNGAGGGFSFFGGVALGTGTGGAFNFNAGSGGIGGSFGVNAGDGTTGGGGFNLSAGSGLTSGGNFVLSAGICVGSSGNGGNYEMSGGSGVGASTGGDFILTAGSSTSGLGGNFVLLPGGGGTSGTIYFSDSIGHNVIQVTDDLTDGQLGFFDAAPVAQQASAPVATNLATAITLVNALRTALLNLGLIV